MKFEALMKDDDSAVREFLNISLSLQKFGKTCILRLTKNKMYFIVSEEKLGPRRPMVWCELPVNFYFKDYKIQDQNDIFLELSTSLLARTCSIFKQNVKVIRIKLLTPTDATYLTFEMELMLEEMRTRRCVHDIPVELVASKYWSDYDEEPIYNDFHVSIQMPKLKAIKNVVEKIKNLGQRVTVSANKTGKLTLEINTNTVELAAHFSDLSVNSFAQEEISNINEDDNKVSATVDLKQFMMFLSGMQLMDCPLAVCNIVQGKMVKLFLEEPGVLKLQIFMFELSV